MQARQLVLRLNRGETEGVGEEVGGAEIRREADAQGQKGRLEGGEGPGPAVHTDDDHGADFDAADDDRTVDVEGAGRAGQQGLEDFVAGDVIGVGREIGGEPLAPNLRSVFPAGDFALERWRADDWVITNPPFAKAEAFVQQGLKVARRGVAVLCRLAFTESVGRYPLMQRKALTAPFAERVPMQLGSWDPDLSSATAYAWFVWMQPEALADSPFRAAIEGAWAMDATLERIIAPGTCERLTQADDRVVYAGETPDPQMGLL